jgi:hypothetical protein
VLKREKKPVSFEEEIVELVTLEWSDGAQDALDPLVLFLKGFAYLVLG